MKSNDMKSKSSIVSESKTFECLDIVLSSFAIENTETESPEELIRDFSEGIRHDIAQHFHQEESDLLKSYLIFICCVLAVIIIHNNYESFFLQIALLLKELIYNCCSFALLYLINAYENIKMGFGSLQISNLFSKKMKSVGTLIENELVNSGVKTQVSAQIFDSLLCPVCLEVLCPPVVNCVSGHSVCAECRPRLAHCGLCGLKFTRMRNYAIESILAHLDIKCYNQACNIIYKADKKAEHQKTCEFRPILCCGDNYILFEYFIPHLTNHHNLSVNNLVGPKFEIRISSTLYSTSQIIEAACKKKILIIEGKTFILTNELVPLRNKLMFWMLMMDTDANAQKHTFSIEIIKPKSGKKMLNLRARSVHIPFDAIFRSGDSDFTTVYPERNVLRADQRLNFILKLNTATTTRNVAL